ncbi:MAG: substrate-binding domain-containing protein [Caldilineaceae bacterium]|nr:substrate-binding domain-containing protein [Caldilineaceae bacterium]MCB0094519.1 substrate-binding domain-containing protein [Caldilineaceae bacterium]MCB9149366.1 substrate-binding domain-containing protein [Caldilineaceae bacterium]
MLYKNSILTGKLCSILLLIVLLASCAAAPAAPEAPAAEPEATEAPAAEAAAEAAEPAPADENNPYRPNSLFEAIDALKAATDGQSPPDGAKYAYMTNNTSPFWTAAQAGVEAASDELSVPIAFQSPTGSDLLSQQLSMLETLVNDGYTGITFSSIDRQAPASIIKRAVDQGIHVLNMDSDATGSERAMYIGMSDYDAGRAAGEAALDIIGSGKVVGLVGFATAQNAQDRIAGVNDVLAGTDLEMVEVLLDDVKPEVALSNAQTAIQKYGDELAGFITFYSYDGPAACQAVKQADKIGVLKVVAFDAEPETQACTEEGVIQAMIGQRVFFYGYLSGYVMYAMSIIGEEETMNVLDPYLDDLGDEGKIRLNTGVDVIRAETLDQYKEYLSSIGIVSQ